MSRALSGGAYHWHEYGIDELLPPAFLVEAGYRPLGVDVRQMGGGTDVIADAHFLPLADACVDLVLSMQVFEHLRAPWLAAAEVARVLRPGGCFVGSVAFLKPYHGSYFHMTHKGVHQLFLQAGLATDAARSLSWRLTCRKDPNAVSQRFDEDFPLSFRTFDRLRFAPAIVFRARKPTNS